MACLALVYVFYAHFPSQKAMKIMRQQLQEKQNYITKIDKAYAEVAAIRSDLDKTTQFVKEWQDNAPDPQQADRLQSQVTAKANKAGVRVTKMQPLAVKKHGLVAEYPIQVSVEGEFEGIFTFFQGVEQLPQTIWFQDVILRRPGELSGDLQCDLTLTIFGDLADKAD